MVRVSVIPVPSKLISACYNFGNGGPVILYKSWKVRWDQLSMLILNKPRRFVVVALATITARYEPQKYFCLPT